VGGTHAEQFVKNGSLWEGLALMRFTEDFLPWEGPHAGVGEECEESSPEEEAAAETMCDELTTVPTPCPPVLLGGRRQRKIRSEVEPGKKGRVGGRCFKICFYFSLSYSDLIGEK